MSKLSITYRFLRAIGLNYSEKEYGNISLWILIKRVFKTYRDGFLLKFLMNSWLFAPISPRKLRPWILRKIGAKVGKNVFIGSDVWIDAGHTDQIIIEDNVHVTGRCILLCHKRNILRYRKGDDASKLPYTVNKIHLKKGCMIGMNTTIMPGVTVGEGSLVGAYSHVTKDIPDWTIAEGRPAKVIKEIPERPKIDNN